MHTHEFIAQHEFFKFQKVPYLHNTNFSINMKYSGYEVSLCCKDPPFQVLSVIPTPMNIIEFDTYLGSIIKLSR